MDVNERLEVINEIKESGKSDPKKKKSYYSLPPPPPLLSSSFPFSSLPLPFFPFISFSFCDSIVI